MIFNPNCAATGVPAFIGETCELFLVVFRNIHSFWFLFIAVVGWLWFPFWGQSQIPAFRDGFHFYYPQYVWLDQCYQRGEYFPMWNANEGLGASVAGQPTWQLFYPLRILWWLPFGDLAQRFAWWIAAHQILAAIGIKRVAAELKLSHAAGWFAAVAFALSCPVMFQHTNIIYLCSAAWIGFALLSIVRLLVGTNRWSNIWCLGVCCSMMLLGGDPHTAVHAGLVGSVAWTVGTFWPMKCRRINTAEKSVERSDPILHSLVPATQTRRQNALEQAAWITISLVIFGLVLVQSFESWTWVRHSSRSPQAARVTDSFHPTIASILESKSNATQHRIFDFSVSPWSLPSLIWPTVGGHYQITHSRWIDALPSESRMWTPSLYVGLLPLLLFGAGFRRAAVVNNSALRRIERFAFWLALVGLLLAMGNYSFLWILRELAGLIGLREWTSSWPVDSSGSLYGLLAHFVPGYDRFRYPAKWLVWFAAGVSIVAGIQLDRKTSDRSHWLATWMCGAWVTVFSLLAIAIWSIEQTFGFIGNRIAADWLRASFDPLLGHADSTEAIRQVAFAIHWPLVVLSLFALSAYFLRFLSIKWLVVLLTAIEMSICCRHWITTTPAPEVVAPSAIGRSDAVRWANARLADISDAPTDDSQSVRTSPNRQSNQLWLQNTYWMGKLAHLKNAGAFHASGSLRPHVVIRLENWLSRHDDMSLRQPRLDEVLGALGVTQRLVRRSDGGFKWVDVEGARPLCEVVLPAGDGGANAAGDSGDYHSWQWMGSSSLRVHCVVQARDAKLIVRQFNDGGWSVKSRTAASIQMEPEELFLVIPIPPGEHDILIER